eukprot:1274358-Rhodomonas_salina.2
MSTMWCSTSLSAARVKASTKACVVIAPRRSDASRCVRRGANWRVRHSETARRHTDRQTPHTQPTTQTQRRHTPNTPHTPNTQNTHHPTNTQQTPKSQEPRAKSQEPRAKSQEPIQTETCSLCPAASNSPGRSATSNASASPTSTTPPACPHQQFDAMQKKKDKKKTPFVSVHTRSASFFSRKRGGEGLSLIHI